MILNVNTMKCYDLGTYSISQHRTLTSYYLSPKLICRVRYSIWKWMQRILPMQNVSLAACNQQIHPKLPNTYFTEHHYYEVILMLFFANRWYSLLTEYHLIFFANSKLRRDAHYFSRQTLRNFSLSLAVSGPRALALALAFALALAPYQNGHETSSRRHLPQFPGSPPKATHHCGKRQNAESPAQEQNQCQRSINIRLQSTANSRLSVTLNCDLGQPLEFPTLTSDLHWRPALILSKSKSGWWKDFPSRGRLRKMDEALSRSQRENSVQKLNTLFIKSTVQDWLQKRALEFVSIALPNQVEYW